MKTKLFIMIICSLLLGIQQGKAQSQAKGKKVLQEIAAKKVEREKQISLLRSKATEQKGQQQFEKRPDAHKEMPPAAGNGPNPDGRERVSGSDAMAGSAKLKD
ncbi:MAG TPA: hypothetical protein VGE06_06390 [Flavisolibacter sp.]